MPPITLPIIDPLGILSEPASKFAQKFIDEDIEFNDPVRDIVIDILDDEEVEAGTTHAPAPQPQTNAMPPPDTPPAPRSAQRAEYYAMGDRLVGDSFTCEKNRAVAEQVARKFAPENHRLQLECLHNIRDFTMYPETTGQFRRAKQWLEQHNLKDLLRQAYMDGV